MVLARRAEGKFCWYGFESYHKLVAWIRTSDHDNKPIVACIRHPITLFALLRTVTKAPSLYAVEL